MRLANGMLFMTIERCGVGEAAVIASFGSGVVPAFGIHDTRRAAANARTQRSRSSDKRVRS